MSDRAVNETSRERALEAAERALDSRYLSGPEDAVHCARIAVDAVWLALEDFGDDALRSWALSAKKALEGLTIFIDDVYADAALRPRHVPRATSLTKSAVDLIASFPSEEQQ